MRESENSELDVHEPAAFGQQLMLAREKAGMTLDEAARALNLKEEMVEAIEDSALDKLPPVTFVQGYVRSYARLLGLSEEKILDEFEAEVPHELESELHPRPPSPDGANSQSPFIKLISLLIIVLALLVLVYAVYSYYIERTEHIEQASQSADDAMMQLPPEAPLIEQQAGITDDDTLSIDTQSAAAEGEEILSEPVVEPVAAVAQQEAFQLEQAGDELADTEQAEVEEAAADVAVVDTMATEDIVASEVNIEDIMPVAKPQPITGGDVLALSAEQESWAQIVDANDIQLFYGMMKPGRELNLTGQAPFEVFLGNAPVVSLSLNSTSIDMTKYIRSNNIAQFKISVENGRVRFH
jgi:cytoskeleton protein RodZ